VYIHGYGGITPYAMAGLQAMGCPCPACILAGVILIDISRRDEDIGMLRVHHDGGFLR